MPEVSEDENDEIIVDKDTLGKKNITIDLTPHPTSLLKTNTVRFLNYCRTLILFYQGLD